MGIGKALVAGPLKKDRFFCGFPTYLGEGCSNKVEDWNISPLEGYMIILDAGIDEPVL